jgi:hypothetical protein
MDAMARLLGAHCHFLEQGKGDEHAHTEVVRILERAADEIRRVDRDGAPGFEYFIPKDSTPISDL